MTTEPAPSGERDAAPWSGYIPAPVTYVFILHDSGPYGFASLAIPRVFENPEVAKEAASEHVGNHAEWLPFGPSLSSLVLKCDGKLTGATIRRVRIER